MYMLFWDDKTTFLTTSYNCFAKKMVSNYMVLPDRDDPACPQPAGLQ